MSRVNAVEDGLEPCKMPADPQDSDVSKMRASSVEKVAESQTSAAFFKICTVCWHETLQTHSIMSKVHLCCNAFRTKIALTKTVHSCTDRRSKFDVDPWRCLTINHFTALNLEDKAKIRHEPCANVKCVYCAISQTAVNKLSKLCGRRVRFALWQRCSVACHSCLPATWWWFGIS